MSVGAYSRWYLADLHVHTTADANHRYATRSKRKYPDPEFADQLCAEFAGVGVSVIAVTDHNRVDWWPVLRHAGKKHRMAVFPGIEISVNRCHLLGIWEANVEGFELAKRFATSLHRPGQSPYVNGSPRPVVSGNVEENARKIVDHGGLVVAPHSTNRTLGMFGPGVCSNSSEIAQSELIAAYDVFGNPGAEVLQNPRSEFLDSPPRWILTGDTRSFEGIGDRAVYLKLGAKPTLEGLRQAFLAPATRVRFPEKSRPDWGRVKGIGFTSRVQPSWPRLTSITVKGGFHDGLDIQLAPGLNAVIGGKGTGKSALIEIVRHVVGARAPADRSLIDNRARNFPANSDGELTYVASDGEEYVVLRSGGTSPPTLMSRGSKSEVDVERRVAVNVFGQRELIELATSTALREFLARGIGARWVTLIDQQRVTTRNLEANAVALRSQETSLADLEDKAAERSDYAERIERARAAGVDEVIAKIEALSKANQQVRRALQWPSAISAALTAPRTLLPAPQVPSEPAALRDLAGSLVQAGDALSDAFADADSAIASASKAVTTAQPAWASHHAQQKTALERELADVGIANPEDLANWQARVTELR